MGDVAKAWVEEQGCWPPTLASDLPNPMDSGMCMRVCMAWLLLPYMCTYAVHTTAAALLVPCQIL